MGLTANPNFSFVTSLEREMKICIDYLHKPHSYFLSLSKTDKLKLFYYDEMQYRRSKQENMKQKLELDALKHKGPK